MAIVKNTKATIHFFILRIGQVLIRIVHYNFNADTAIGFAESFKGSVWNYTVS